MAQNNQFFQQSQFSLAAYADLSSPLIRAQYIAALVDQGMTDSQAQQFADQYTVIDQVSDTTGLSATIFQDQSGKRYLAIRGTESPGDFLADAFVLSGWPSFLSPQFLTLRSQVQRWMDSGVLPSRFTITGHSLGGYLAAALGSWFSANNIGTYLLNTPGVGGVVGNFANSFRSAIGLGNVALVSNIFNIRASSGLSLISGLGIQLAPPMFVETDFSANPFVNHSIVTITDSLSVYDLLDRLQPGIGVEETATVLRAASIRSADMLTSVINPLTKIFGGSETLIGDREALYRAIHSIESQVPVDGTSPYRFASLGKLDAETLATAAKMQDGDGLAYRYALSKLNPFVVLGANYSELNVAGELGIFDPTTGAGLTEAYLDDRAAMLVWKNESYQEDGNLTLRNLLIETQQYIDKTIKDVRTGGDLTFTVVGTQLSAVSNPSMVIFGGDGADSLIGSEIAAGDRLYGGDGADTLQGNGGNDYLEGGSGNDTYVWNTGDGFDAILDTDGIGKLVVNGRIVSGAIQITQNYFISADKQDILHFEGNLGTGGILVINGDVEIENFTNGDLGIALGGEGSLNQIQPTTTVFTRPFSDTRVNIGFGTNGADSVIETESVFVAKSGDDFLKVSANGHAEFYAGPGGDIVVGGDLPLDGIHSTFSGDSGSDIILGGEDSEVIDGDFRFIAYSQDRFSLPTFDFDGGFSFGILDGVGYWHWTRDFFEVDDSDTPIESFHGTYADAFNYALGITNDLELNTLYDDYIEGSGGNDRISGGNGADVIFGGSGDDIAIGDGFSLIPQGSIQTPQWLTDAMPLLGVPGNDFIDGGLGDDMLGDDPVRVGLDSMGGSDVLIGGEGNDFLNNIDPSSEFASYSNYLDGGAGDDILSTDNRSLNGFDTLIGDLGNDALTIGILGNAEMDGGPGNDTFTVGMLANANMDGGAGSDSYAATFVDSSFLSLLLPGLSPGGVVISDKDEHGSDVDSLSVSMLSIGEIPLSITRDESNLYFGTQTLPHWLTIEDWFTGIDHKIEAISLSFTDFNEIEQPTPLVYDIAAIENQFVTATTAADFLWGSSAGDQISGGLGDDALFGDAGNDVLSGNQGSDFLDGGIGDDTYVFNIGDGIDQILDSGKFGADSISFGSGITPNMLVWVPDALSINIGETGNTIHVDDLGPTGELISSNIEFLQFADGTVLTFQQFLNGDLDPIGAEIGDSVGDAGVGGVSSGSAGNDIPNGSAGSEPLNTGTDVGSDVVGHVSVVDSSKFALDIETSGFGISRGGDFFAIDSGADQFSTLWQIEQGLRIGNLVFSGISLWDAQYFRDNLRLGLLSDPWYDDGSSHGHRRGLDSFQANLSHGRDPDRGEGKLQHERNSDISGLFEEYLAQNLPYDLDAYETISEPGKQKQDFQTPLEIAEQWQRVGRFVNGLSDESDKDARMGIGELFASNDSGYLGGGSPGGTFGHAGSTGSTRGYANLRTLQGLEDGFQRLRLG